MEAHEPTKARILANNEFKVLKLQPGQGYQAPDIVYDHPEEMTTIDRLSTESMQGRIGQFKKLRILLYALIVYGFFIIIIQYIPLQKPITRFCNFARFPHCKIDPPLLLAAVSEMANKAQSFMSI